MTLIYNTDALPEDGQHVTVVGLMESKYRHHPDDEEVYDIDFLPLGEWHSRDEVLDAIAQVPEALQGSLNKLSSRNHPWAQGSVRHRIYAFACDDPIGAKLAKQIALKNELPPQARANIAKTITQNYVPLMGTIYPLPPEPNFKPSWWTEDPNEALKTFLTPGRWGFGKTNDRRR